MADKAMSIFIFYFNAFLRMLQGEKSNMNISSWSEIQHYPLFSIWGNMPTFNHSLTISKPVRVLRRQHFAHEIGFEQDSKLILLHDQSSFLDRIYGPLD